MGVIRQVIIIDLNKIFIIDVNKIQNCHWNKQKNFAHGALSIPSRFHIKPNNITLGKKIDTIKFIYTTYPA